MYSAITLIYLMIIKLFDVSYSSFNLWYPTIMGLADGINAMKYYLDIHPYIYYIFRGWEME